MIIADRSTTLTTLPMVLLKDEAGIDIDAEIDVLAKTVERLMTLIIVALKG